MTSRKDSVVDKSSFVNVVIIFLLHRSRRYLHTGVIIFTIDLEPVIESGTRGANRVLA